MDFELVDAPINTAALRARLLASGAGGFASFEGWVRDHHEGRAVRGLAYSSYRALAQAEGERILAEARARFAIVGAGCAHRLGELPVGEMAVWVGVSAAHRGPAFCIPDGALRRWRVRGRPARRVRRAGPPAGPG